MSTERSSSDITVNDLQNPLFIHPADQAGQSIIPFKLTGADNYRKWEKAVEKAFAAKCELGFIRDTIERTTENAGAWHRCNDMCSWIIGVVSNEIYERIFEMDTAFDMWKD
ncbi:hypothetical protein Ancab_040505 [Ancistrocladus abbreviatus]